MVTHHKRSGMEPTAKHEAPTARSVALGALVRIERDGAYANLALPKILTRAQLSDRDTRFATELVYGTLRMRRACDFIVDRFITRDLDPEVRVALRLGAYQLCYLDTPAHAAVSETVDAVPGRAGGLVNAVLRRVADNPVIWPNAATELSYPDWIVKQLSDELGEERALAALATMNEAPEVTERADGYIQDRGSQAVVKLLGIAEGDVVLDMCAAPGGKATGLAQRGARVVAADVRPKRVALIAENAERLGLVMNDREAGGSVVWMATDGRAPGLALGSMDAVLVDAPCSGIGALRRRPDARWRITPDDVTRLSDLQIELVRSALKLVKPGGEVLYSVCTITDAETKAIDETFADVETIPIDEAPWAPHGRGAILLPQFADTDGMYALRLRAPGGAPIDTASAGEAAAPTEDAAVTEVRMIGGLPTIARPTETETKSS